MPENVRLSLCGYCVYNYSGYRADTRLCELLSEAQPALHFGGVNFHEISFDDVIVLIHPWYNFFTNGHK